MAEQVASPVVVEKPLTAWERISGNSAVRKTALLVLLALFWELYARKLDNSLLFPTFGATLEAFGQAIASGVIPQRTGHSLRVLGMGYAAGLFFAAILTAFPTATRIGTDLFELSTAMFNPLPSHALLLPAMPWWGL